MFFGIKCYINQARNNIFTNPSVNVFITRYKTGNLMYIGASEVEISNFESHFEKTGFKDLASRI